MSVSFQVNGEVSVTGLARGVTKVIVYGDIVTSGCQDQAIADAVGIDNLIVSSDFDKVLGSFSKEHILDYIVNVSEWDLDEIINQLKIANEL